jgi:hypothetical protein
VQVIFCFEEESDVARFQASLALVFPRTTEEVARSIEALQGVDMGNEWGERVIEDRKIRCVHRLEISVVLSV